MHGEGVNDTAFTKRSITRVDWFQRDPGGGTIFVKPAGHDATADLPADREPRR
jgi:hypothetical protein